MLQQFAGQINVIRGIDFHIGQVGESVEVTGKTKKPQIFCAGGPKQIILG